MDSPAPYVHAGIILISLPNLILIIVMLLLFAAAMLAPFPHAARRTRRDRRD